MADTYTKIADLIDPEVMGDMVSARIPKKLRVAPFAKVDDTLAGVPGDTITVPAYAYIGDADNVAELCELFRAFRPDIVVNVALPYQDLTIMDACLKAGVNYIDTANYEPEDTDDPEWRAIYEKRCKDEGFTAYFDYSWQWAYQEKFKEAGHEYAREGCLSERTWNKLQRPLLGHSTFEMAINMNWDNPEVGPYGKLV